MSCAWGIVFFFITLCRNKKIYRTYYGGSHIVINSENRYMNRSFFVCAEGSPVITTYFPNPGTRITLTC